MYRRIMTDKLKFPATMSEPAKSLIEGISHFFFSLLIFSGLLQRDPEQRLRDPSKIKEHSFFAGIDWDALYSKKTKPPYIPSVVKRKFQENSIDFVFRKGRLM
jgi:RAC serine/threonine-protein kinase